MVEAKTVTMHSLIQRAERLYEYQEELLGLLDQELPSNPMQSILTLIDAELVERGMGRSLGGLLR